MTKLELPDVDASTPIEEVDAAVAQVLVPHAERGLVQLVGDLSDFTDQEPLYAAGGAVIGTGLVLRDERTVRAGTRMLAAHLLATALRGVVKRLVVRTRPDAAARRGEYRFAPGERRESEFSSFPSGHTAGAIAAARALGRHYPGSYHAWLGLAGAASVTQVLRSKHYVTDVVAGAAIGVFAEELIDRLIRRAERI
uniref:phosphatase PAP2 family protein n=1 Tax=uncultured Sphingomonas sp. TaxID=158754 RepID=UPI0025EDCF35|nr:phosphatase PAP2 family protein [uncultured Sphingomonas sp.]